jgi:hypothetical protein
VIRVPTPAHNRYIWGVMGWLRLKEAPRVAVVLARGGVWQPDDWNNGGPGPRKGSTEGSRRDQEASAVTSGARTHPGPGLASAQPVSRRLG